MKEREEHPPLIPPIKGGKLPLHIRKKGIRMDTEKRLAKRVDFLRNSIYISYRNTYEAMNTLSCESLYEAISMPNHLCNYFKFSVTYCVLFLTSLIFLLFFYLDYPGVQKKEKNIKIKLLFKHLTLLPVPEEKIQMIHRNLNIL